MGFLSWLSRRKSNDFKSVAIEDLDTNPVQTINANTQNIDNQTRINDNQEILFELQKCLREDLAASKIGDRVILLMPKKYGGQQIYIYRIGSIGDNGRLGDVPNEYLNIVSTHLTQDLEYKAEILDINISKSMCKIKLSLVSKQETETRQERLITDFRNRLSIELQKQFTSRDALTIKLSLLKTHSLNKGQEIFLEKQSLEYYIQNGLNLQINLVDTNGVIVAKINEPKKILILRAFFSQCAMRILIESIEKPEVNTLKFENDIQATAIVYFDKAENALDNKNIKEACRL
jgi:hypothetical protein